MDKPEKYKRIFLCWYTTTEMVQYMVQKESECPLEFADTCRQIHP